MKKTCIILSLIVLPLGLFAQNYGQNQKAQMAFNQKFTNVELLYEEEGEKESVFGFYQNGNYKEVIFDRNGTWLLTRSEIDLVNLPASISSVIKSEFGIFTYENIIQIEIPGDRKYEVEISTESQYITLIFNNQLQLISREVEPIELKQDNYEDYEDYETPDNSNLDDDENKS